MPAIMEQVSRLSVSEKLNLMECIIKSIGMSVVAAEPVKPARASRIGICRGMWKLPTWEEDQTMDREIEAEFEASLENPL